MISTFVFEFIIEEPEGARAITLKDSTLPPGIVAAIESPEVTTCPSILFNKILESSLNNRDCEFVGDNTIFFVFSALIFLIVTKSFKLIFIF